MNVKHMIGCLVLLASLPVMGKVKVESMTPQTAYAAERLQGIDERFTVTLRISGQGQDEAFTLTRKGRSISIEGSDGAGCIYGANRLMELVGEDPSLATLTTLHDAPQMVMRGTCIGLQKTVYLPGHAVYEYPYTPENFPWFYDKAQWIAYLDMMAANNLNSLYLWNGHPFASLVKLKDYPFALEVDEDTFRQNEEIFNFLTTEAQRRGIRIIQMFYNIILSKPFADHYGLKTQDRHRPITPLIADYTRKSIAAFVEKYPNVGFLVCLGEAMATIEDDITWMKETIIPGILDGLKASGRYVATASQHTGQGLPPIILRAHDTDGPRVLRESLPLYPNIYTMSKYTGESLTTYEPGGPWGETHRQLAAVAPVHIDNVHILANLEPWRWSSPAFIQKTVQAMHRVHHSRGLHLYPQASYWDWPYTGDRLPDGQRLRQLDRDWMWYRAWGRYAWNSERGSDTTFWCRELSNHFGISEEAAGHLLTAYDEAGEIAPKLLRRFGITEGNRQTLLLGMKMAQLVNPYKFNVYPGFYESCGPQGEKLIEYVEREQKGQSHEGELPLDIAAQCVEHGRKAVEAFEAAVQSVAAQQQQTGRQQTGELQTGKHNAGQQPAKLTAELRRIGNDFACYALFARSFQQKVLAAQQVLNYKWTKDVACLDAAVPLLEQSLELWRALVQMTDSTYLYANSMQTAQRRIPVGGDGGGHKTWRQMLPVYEEELYALRENIAKLKAPTVSMGNTPPAAIPAPVSLIAVTGLSSANTVPLQKGAVIFENRPDTPVDSLAPELASLQALVLNRDTTRIVGTTITFDAPQAVKLLVGFFQDDDPKWAKPPKLETDATGNEYGQAEPVLTNAVSIVQMPKVNIHAYHLPAGSHELRLPKGILMIAGFTADDIKPRDCGLNSAGNEVDWLFLQASAQEISYDKMQAIYDEVKTPYKYGMVVAPGNNYHKFDCPTVFRQGDKWLMTYVCYDGKDGTDGRGYETWLASSDDLLHWKTEGRLLSFKDDGWDMNQRGGFPSLIDWTWGGSYEMAPYKGRHWMTYIGGHGTGYEAVREPLNIGLAWTKGNIAEAHEWQSADKPLLSINDRDVQWWEQLVQYKSTVYDDPQKTLGKRFVMFYNAGGINPGNQLKAERIGIALSNDLKRWQRYDGNPVYFHEVPGSITGDAQIVKMDGLWVMFYFSAYNPARPYNAYNTFAVSRDLVHWQDWNGPDLIVPSKPYDEMFAHKSYVLKHKGVVYHFYCAVNNAGQRGIALATSTRLGRSDVHFPEPEPVGRRITLPLNDGWTGQLSSDTVAVKLTLPHNFDDYYGYRQLRHGNLHGSAVYTRSFQSEKHQGKRYFLQFEGVGTYATVTLNGTQYPRELVGRTVWTLDVTDALRNGDNQLSVLVDHPAMQTESPWVCGGCSSEWGFSEGSQPFGIFRPVTLIATDEVRIEPFGVHVWANAACDSVFIDTEVKNYGTDPQTVELVNKFAEKSGKQVFRCVATVALLPGEAKTIRSVSPVTNAHRWSLGDPYLYTLTTMVKRPSNGQNGTSAMVTIDDVRTTFGIRCVSWPHSAGGSFPASTDGCFRLNGQRVFINGTCEYEHLLGGSHAFSHEQIASRVKQIRYAGFNAFREAHQPHNLYYQQLLDEQGLLFWSQFSAHIWYDTPQFRDNFKRLLVRWIKERRNSPSIVLWGLQNESVLPKDFAEECSDIIRSLDPTASTQRLITTCNGGEGTDWNVVQNWSGTYGGTPDNYAEELSRPDQLLNGEYGAWRTLDLHGSDKYSEESFTALLEKKARLARQAFAAGAAGDGTGSGVCGHFQWLFTSHDNPGRTQPDGALRRIDKIGPINYKGLLTIWEEPTLARYGLNSLSSTPSLIVGSQGEHPAQEQASLLAPWKEAGTNYLYRINCGGDAYTDSYGNLWQADDSLLSHSWGQDFPSIHPFQASQRHLTAPIHGTADPELFQFFRFGRHRLWYDLPVSSAATSTPASAAADGLPVGTYRIELYFLEPWHGKGDTGETADYEGLRIFDVAVNDSLVIDDLDPWAEAGYATALKRVVYAPAKDGRLRISFPEVKAGQAVIAAIAVAQEGAGANGASGYNKPLESQSTFWHSLDTDTIARLPKDLLPQDTDVRPATVYEPSESKSGISTWTITPGLGQEYALRFRYKNTSGQAVTARLRLMDSKQAMLVDRTLSFPPTPNKFKMLSTTTGTQINAGTYRLTVEGEGIEFQNLEIQ